jgi:hypothetical protein
LKMIRESGRGFGPLLVWALLGVLQIGSVLAVPGLLISAIPSVFSAQASQSITASATAIGADLTIHCPQTPPLLIGEQFSCTGTTTSGSTNEITVSLQRINGWIEWQVDDWGVYTLDR